MAMVSAVEEHETHVSVRVPIPSHLPRTTLLCVSDTHDLHAEMPHSLPRADVFVHAGDFTMRGCREELQNFQKWTDELLQNGVCEDVVFCGGNHECGLPLTAKHERVRAAQEAAKIALTQRPHVHYLEDSGCEIRGLRFFGSPWTAVCGRDWAWQVKESELVVKFGEIPDAVDILVTHQPPLGQGDQGESGPGARLGSRALMDRVETVAPLVHVFGHIHTGHGVSTRQGLPTSFVNAAICNEDYRPVQRPVLVDLCPVDRHD